MSRRQVVVVKDAERMTTEAANCFLKTLEEPPGEAYFILIATTLWNVPETVVSRCRLLRLAALPPREVERKLGEEGAEAEDARWLAWRSWGSYGEAQRFREAGLHELNARLVDELLGLALKDNFRLSDWLGGQARESGESAAEARQTLQELLECVAVFYRDAAAAAVAPDSELFNQGRAEQIRRLAARVPRDRLIQCAEAALAAIDHVGGNANRRLALDHLFTALAEAQQADAA
jgi:DNA polymerase-3 subunit delta'